MLRKEKHQGVCWDEKTKNKTADKSDYENWKDKSKYRGKRMQTLNILRLGQENADSKYTELGSKECRPKSYWGGVKRMQTLNILRWGQNNADPKDTEVGSKECRPWMYWGGVQRMQTQKIQSWGQKNADP